MDISRITSGDSMAYKAKRAINNKFRKEFGNTTIEETVKSEESKSEKTKSDIVTKPDGSRVLVVTTSIGGMETTMSLEISKPTDAFNTLNGNENQEAADENRQQKN